jgi:DNA-binding transcriptional LysR family regulator
MAQTIVSRLVTEFSSKHPRIKIECIVTNQYLDLTKENIDLAFRAGKLSDSNLIQRKLHEVELISVASKSYLQKYGTPQLENDLDKHKIMSFKGIDSFPNPTITTDSFAMLLNMTLLGKGIATIPDFICKEYLDSGELVKIFPFKKGNTSSIHIVYPPSRNIPLKTKKFIKLATSMNW